MQRRIDKPRNIEEDDEWTICMHKIPRCRVKCEMKKKNYKEHD